MTRGSRQSTEVPNPSWPSFPLWSGWTKDGDGLIVDANAAVAKEKLFDYIEVFYNHQRRHSSLDYVTPAGYEKAARAPVATA